MSITNSSSPISTCRWSRYSPAHPIFRRAASWNGDNLVIIQEFRIAISYAIEALRVFDHLHFRTVMSDAFGGSKDATDSARGEHAAAGALAALT